MAARRVSETADWTEQDLAYAASIVLKIFRTYDVDNGGTLQIRELEHFLHRCGARLTPNQITAIINQLDVDGDGEMNFSEFMAFLGRLYQLQFYGTDAGPPQPRKRSVDSNTSYNSAASVGSRNMTPTQQPVQRQRVVAPGAQRPVQSPTGSSNIPLVQKQAQLGRGPSPAPQRTSPSPRNVQQGAFQATQPGRSGSPVPNVGTSPRNVSQQQGAIQVGRSGSPVSYYGATPRNIPQQQQGRNYNVQSRNTPPAVPPDFRKQSVEVQGSNPQSRYR